MTTPSTTDLSKLFDTYTTTITLYKDAIEGDSVELQGCITAQAELQADILALIQAHEQQYLHRYLGKDVVLEQIGDGKYKVYANPEYVKAAKQQLLTELLGEAIEVNTDDDVNVPVVPVSVIEAKLAESQPNTPNHVPSNKEVNEAKLKEAG